VRTYSIFDADTGLLAGRAFSTDIADPVEHARIVAMNTPDGHGAVEGEHDHLSRRVDIATGAVVDYQPPAPSTDHEWSVAMKRWQFTAPAQAALERRRTALARHAELISQQHDDMRRAVLGDAAALEGLKAIEIEIASLSL
jgi:hypothetical protein